MITSYNKIFIFNRQHGFYPSKQYWFLFWYRVPVEVCLMWIHFWSFTFILHTCSQSGLDICSLDVTTQSLFKSNFLRSWTKLVPVFHECIKTSWKISLYFVPNKNKKVYKKNKENKTKKRNNKKRLNISDLKHAKC